MLALKLPTAWRKQIKINSNAQFHGSVTLKNKTHLKEDDICWFKKTKYIVKLQDLAENYQLHFSLPVSLVRL